MERSAALLAITLAACGGGGGFSSDVTIEFEGSDTAAVGGFAYIDDNNYLVVNLADLTEGCSDIVDWQQTDGTYAELFVRNDVGTDSRTIVLIASVVGGMVQHGDEANGTVSITSVGASVSGSVVYSFTDQYGAFGANGSFTVDFCPSAQSTRARE